MIPREKIHVPRGARLAAALVAASCLLSVSCYREYYSTVLRVSMTELDPDDGSTTALVSLLDLEASPNHGYQLGAIAMSAAQGRWLAFICYNSCVFDDYSLDVEEVVQLSRASGGRIETSSSGYMPNQAKGLASNVPRILLSYWEIAPQVCGLYGDAITRGDLAYGMKSWETIVGLGEGFLRWDRQDGHPALFEYDPYGSLIGTARIEEVETGIKTAAFGNNCLMATKRQSFDPSTGDKTTIFLLRTIAPGLAIGDAIELDVPPGNEDTDVIPCPLGAWLFRESPTGIVLGFAGIDGSYSTLAIPSYRHFLPTASGRLLAWSDGDVACYAMTGGSVVLAWQYYVAPNDRNEMPQIVSVRDSGEGIAVLLLYRDEKMHVR